MLEALKGVPSFTILKDENLTDFLVTNKITSSKREARELITANAILINGEVVNDVNYFIDKSKTLYKEFIIVRKGKKKYYLGSYK